MNNEDVLSAIVRSVEEKIIGRVANVSHDGIETLNEAEKILYYIWILSIVFVSISATLSVLYDKMNEDELPKFRREGNRLIRI